MIPRAAAPIPSAVLISASEIPFARPIASGAPAFANAANALIIPNTVPSNPTSVEMDAQVVKRRKAGCPIALETQRAEDGATHVQVIHPSEETPNLDRKLARLIETCIARANVSSVELQVRDFTRT